MAGTISRADAVNALWHRGDLRFKLNSTQKDIYNTFKKTKEPKVVFNCSRRIGKSHVLLTIALEQAITVPNSQIKYACPTARAAKKIIIPSLQKLIEDCPEDLAPKYHKNEGVYKFPNGSELHIEGVDGPNAERLRGTASHLSIIDEAGFTDNLHYVINAILLPQAMTTNGRLIISSTPPESADHDFIEYIKEAQINGSYVQKTIMDYLAETENDPPHLRHISREQIEVQKKASGGDKSTDWRREYMVEIIKDAKRAIIPEFTDELSKKVTKDWPRPGKYDAYTSMDFGWKDLHAVLFAYYDFRNAVLVIEDELLMPGKDTNTAILAAHIRQKEKGLWKIKDSDSSQEPYLRIADDDMLILQDMQQLHGLTVIPTKKDNKDMMINDLRLKLVDMKIIINPRCKNLLYQLENGLWHKTKNEFARQINGGHCDAIDALLYLVRNTQWKKNPYPADWDHPTGDVFIPNPNEQKETQAGKLIKGLFFKKPGRFNKYR